MLSTMNLVIRQTADDGTHFDTSHTVDVGKLVDDYDSDIVTYVQEEFAPAFEWVIA